MRHISHWHRGTLVFLTLAVSLAVAAPAAEAGHGRGKQRYKGYRGRDRGPDRVIIHRSSSSTGAAIGGFIGGLIVGTAIARPQPYYETRYEGGPRYSYGDPYCHERFSSLDRYGDHARLHRRVHRRLLLAGRPVGRRLPEHRLRPRRLSGRSVPGPSLS
jgi:hypothetical protein